MLHLLPEACIHVLLRSMSLEEAEGYALLEMFDDAWAAVEDLSREERVGRRAMRVRIRCAVWHQNYELAEVLANVLRHGEEIDRILAACTFQTLAARFSERGQTKRAGELIDAAIETSPEQRLAILCDSRFPPDFI
jgi:hypothetical protein